MSQKLDSLREKGDNEGMPGQCEPCDREYHQNLEMIDIAVINTAADECLNHMSPGRLTFSMNQFAICATKSAIRILKR